MNDRTPDIQDGEALRFSPLEGYIDSTAIAECDAIPLGSSSLAEALKNLSRGVLKAPEALKAETEKPGEKQALKLAQRYRDGYKLIKHVTQSGEVTVARFRGPLVPNLASNTVTEEWMPKSNWGAELQLLDDESGMLDISYSMVWDLGKKMALADISFTISLSRLRRDVSERTLAGGKKGVMRTESGRIPRLNLLDFLSESTNSSRMTEENGTAIDPANNGDQKILILDNDSDPGDKYKKLYDEFTRADNPNWKVVLKWILDRLCLIGVPFQHLVIDPRYLPKESLRFFEIDLDWISALIDGALSLGCTTEHKHDSFRELIMGTVKVYLETVDIGLGAKPQVPLCGFLMRSDIITNNQEYMKVLVLDKGEDKKRKIVRQQLMGEGVLIYLFEISLKLDRY